MDAGQELCGYCRRRRTPAEAAGARRSFASISAVGGPGAASAFLLRALGWTAAAAATIAGGAALFRSREAVADNARAGLVALSIAANLFGGSASPGEGAAAKAGTPAPPAAGADAPPSSARTPPPAAPRCRVADPARETTLLTHADRALYGVVYDLATGCPIAGASVTYSDANGTPIRPTTTDADGFFQMALLRGGYESGRVFLTVRAAGYRAGQLEDGDPPYRERDAKARREALEQVSERDLEPIPLRFPSGAEKVQQDVVLLPLASAPAAASDAVAVGARR